MIDTKQHKEHAYIGCLGILRLAGSNPPERVEAACRLALQSSSTSYMTITNILLNKRDLLLTDVQPSLFKLPSHDNLRESDATTDHSHFLITRVSLRTRPDFSSKQSLSYYEHAANF
jgi:hypothetical protein